MVIETQKPGLAPPFFKTFPVKTAKDPPICTSAAIVEIATKRTKLKMAEEFERSYFEFGHIACVKVGREFRLLEMLSHPSFKTKHCISPHFPHLHFFLCCCFQFPHSKPWPGVKTANLNRLISNLLKTLKFERLVGPGENKRWLDVYVALEIFREIFQKK